MNPTIKNVLAVVAGIIIGSIVNMSIIMLSSAIIPLPEGVDATNAESLKAAMSLFEPKHFIMPFLAHALGTLAGAYIAARFAANKPLFFALFIGAFFLIGGIANVMMIGAPIWFNALDLIGAYLPMAYAGARLTQKI